MTGQHTVKLQKVSAYRYGDREQFKYVITLPEEIIEALRWETGSELGAVNAGDRIVINFISKPSEEKRAAPKEPKITYSEFRDRIKKVLQYSDDGMTWTEIRTKLGLEQIVPNNKWVTRMEKDIGLKRFREIRGIIWRISHV